MPFEAGHFPEKKLPRLPMVSPLNVSCDPPSELFLARLPWALHRLSPGGKGFRGPEIWMSKLSHEKKSGGPLLSIESCLVNRDPYNVFF